MKLPAKSLSCCILATAGLMMGSVPASAEEFIHRYQSGNLCYVVITDTAELTNWKYQAVKHCNQDAYLFTTSVRMKGAEVLQLGFIFDSQKLWFNEERQTLLSTGKIPCG